MPNPGINSNLKFQTMYLFLNKKLKQSFIYDYNEELGTTQPDRRKLVYHSYMRIKKIASTKG